MATHSNTYADESYDYFLHFDDNLIWIRTIVIMELKGQVDE